jgi:hypothetical protein
VLRSVVGFIAGANRMPFANFMIANSAGAVAWALFYGLGAYYLGKGVEEFARPFAMALAVVGAIVVISIANSSGDILHLLSPDPSAELISLALFFPMFLPSTRPRDAANSNELAAEAVRNVQPMRGYCA